MTKLAFILDLNYNAKGEQQQQLFKKSLEVHRFCALVSQKKQMSCDFSADLLLPSIPLPPRPILALLPNPTLVAQSCHLLLTRNKLGTCPPEVCHLCEKQIAQ